MCIQTTQAEEAVEVPPLSRRDAIGLTYHESTWGEDEESFT